MKPFHLALVAGLALSGCSSDTTPPADDGPPPEVREDGDDDGHEHEAGETSALAFSGSGEVDSATLLRLVLPWNVLIDPRVIEVNPTVHSDDAVADPAELLRTQFPEARVAHRGQLVLISTIEVPGWGNEGLPNSDPDEAAPLNSFHCRPGTPAKAWFAALAEQGGLGELVMDDSLADALLANEALLNRADPADALVGSALLNGFSAEIADGRCELRKGSALYPDGPPAYAAAGPSTPVAPDDLEGQIETLFTEIHQLASDGHDQDVIRRVEQLRGAMEAAGSEGLRAGKRALTRWKDRLKAANADLVLSINLQLYVCVGNGHLRAMNEAIRAKTFATVPARQAKVEKLATSMERFKHEVFHNHADALRSRSEALAARAKTLEAVTEAFGPLRVSALGVTAQESAESFAVINGTAHRVGPLDGETPLEITKIAAGRVTFSWEHGSFTLGVE